MKFCENNLFKLGTIGVQLYPRNETFEVLMTQKVFEKHKKNLQLYLNFKNEKFTYLCLIKNSVVESNI